MISKVSLKNADYLCMIMRILYPQRWAYALGTVVGISCSVLGSLVHYNVSRMVQSSFESPELIHFIWMATILNAFSGLASMLRGNIFTRINQKLYTATFRRIFKHVTDASMEMWDTVFVQEELSKSALSDVGEVVSTSSMVVNVFSRTAATVVCVTWMLNGICPELYVLCMLICVVQVACVHFIYDYYGKFADATRRMKEVQENHVNGYIQNHVHYQLYSLQPIYMDIFDDQSIEHARLSAEEANAYSAIIFCNHILPRSLEFAFTYAIYAMGHGNKVIEIVSYYSIVVDALNGMKDVLISFIRTKESAIRVKRYLEVYVSPRVYKHNKPRSFYYSVPPSISFEDVSFTYPTRTAPVLESFDFHIQPKDKWAIIAKSGRGKTTLMKLLLNMYPLTKGVIKIGTRNVIDISLPELRMLVAVVPQEPLLFPQKTLRENMLISNAHCGASTEELHEILDRVRLSDFKPDLDRKLTALSGGQKQRLAIARVMASKAPIVIFDEPTSALDEENTRALMEEISLHCKNKTVLFITHNVNLTTGMRTLHL